MPRRGRGEEAAIEENPASAVPVATARQHRPARRRALARPGKTFALALGAGGARGLAHIPVLEALDELGIRPVAIAGCSMGAIIGAAYAAGMSGRDIRAHTQAITRDRSKLLQAVFRARVGRFLDLMGGAGHPVVVDGERLLLQLLPELPATFAELQIPFAAIATDFRARSEAILREGPLLPALAASAAIPGLVRPVVIGGRAFIDGGATDPLPVHALEGAADVVIGVDVTGGPLPGEATAPRPFEAMLGAIQLLQGAVVRARLAQRPGDVILRPGVDAFRVLDFLKASAVLRAAEPIREETKRVLEQALA